MAEEFIAHLSQLTDTGPQREEANEYFAAVKQENPLFYLTSIADFVNQLEEETPETETLVTAALILLCDILKEKPEQGFSRELTIELWESIPDEVNTEVKKAAYRGLIFDSQAIRNQAAFALSLLMRLERGKFWEVFDFLNTVLQNPEYSWEIKLSAMEAIQLICRIDDSNLDFMAETLDPSIEIMKAMLFDDDVIDCEMGQDILLGISDTYDALFNNASPPSKYCNDEIYPAVYEMLKRILEKAQNTDVLLSAHMFMYHFYIRMYNVDEERAPRYIPYDFIKDVTLGEINSDNEDLQRVAMTLWNHISLFEFEKMEKKNEYIQYEQNRILHLGARSTDCLYPYSVENFYNNTSMFAKEAMMRIMDLLLVKNPDATSIDDDEDGDDIQSVAAELISHIIHLCGNEPFEMIKGFVTEKKNSLEWTERNATALLLNAICTKDIKYPAKVIFDECFDDLIVYTQQNIPRLTMSALNALMKASSKYKFLTEERLGVFFEQVGPIAAEGEPKICNAFLGVINSYLKYCIDYNIEPDLQDTIVGFTQSCTDRSDSPSENIFNTCYDLFTNFVKSLKTSSHEISQNVCGLVQYSIDTFLKTLDAFADDMNLRFSMQQSILEFVYHAFLKFKYNLKSVAETISDLLMRMLESGDWVQFSTPPVSKVLSISIKYNSKGLTEEFAGRVSEIISRMMDEGGPADFANATLLLGNLFRKEKSMHSSLNETLNGIIQKLEQSDYSVFFAPFIVLGITEILSDYTETMQQKEKNMNNDRSRVDIATTQKYSAERTGKFAVSSDDDDEGEKGSPPPAEEIEEDYVLDDNSIDMFFHIYHILSAFPFSKESAEEKNVSEQVFRILFRGYKSLAYLIHAKGSDWKHLWNSNKKMFEATTKAFIEFGCASKDAFYDYIVFIDALVDLLPKQTNIFVNRMAFRKAIILAESQGNEVLKDNAHKAFRRLENK